MFTLTLIPKGYRPTLYTVIDVNNITVGKFTNSRRIYKYSSSTSVDIDISNSQYSGLQTLSMTLTSRQYCDFDISGGVFGDNKGDIWNYTTVLNNTNLNNINGGVINWTNDLSFNAAYVGWSFGNRVTGTSLPVNLFYTRNNEQKWSFIQLQPFSSLHNQFGVEVASIAWDGSLTTPLVNTRVVTIAPVLNTANIPNDTRAIEKYGLSSLQQ